MPKASPLQENFSAGEISPLIKGRVSLDRYQQSLSTCLNYIPVIQGGLTRRPGTKFVATAKTQTQRSRLIPFKFSTEQAYILEFGHLYIRFYKNNGQILLSGVPYEISSPYEEADLDTIKFTQSADVLYLTHPDFAPRKLNRFGDTNWTLETIDFQDGPYFSVNSRVNNTTVSLTPSAATGTGVTLTTAPTRTITNAVNNGSGLIRITATGHDMSTRQRVFITGVTGTTEANGNWTITVIDANTFDLQGSTFTNAYVAGGTTFYGVFESTDVGRLIRLKEGSVWGWARITAFTDVAHAVVEVESTLTNVNAKNDWRLGVWSETTGYPSCVTFHEDRLFFGGNDEAPQRLDGSRSGDYENFAPSDTSGTITDSHAVGFSLNSDDVNAIRWLTSDEKGLLVGTVGGEWAVKPSSQSEALSPTNISAKPATRYGSADVTAVQVGKSALFIQRAGRKLREMTYFFDVDGFRCPDLTLLSEHITQSGVKATAYQQEPQSLIWCVRNDGVLACMTYERDLDSLKVGWHRHIIGGQSDAAGTNAKVESVAVIPSADGTRDELWMIVQRRINGATKRYVEYLTKLFEDVDEQKDAFFVDSGLTYDDPKTVTGVSSASSAVITCTAHGFSNGAEVMFYDIAGVKVSNESIINGFSFVATVINANSFSIPLNTTLATAYISGGKVRKLVSTVSGLSHLEGETVAVWGDGAVQPTKTVSGGSITLSFKAAVVQVGYNYNSDGQLNRIEAGAADGTALGKTRRTQNVGFLLHRSLGLKIGMNFNRMDTVTFRKSSDPLTRAVPLFTGIKHQQIEATYDYENQIAFRQDQPGPSTILAIMPQLIVQDR